MFAGISLLGPSACEVHRSDISAQQQTPSFKVYLRPANGYFLCLSSVPGTPIHANAPAGTSVGQTGDVVAFAGFSERRLGQYSTLWWLTRLGYRLSAQAFPAGPSGPAVHSNLGIHQEPVFYIDLPSSRCLSALL